MSTPGSSTLLSENRWTTTRLLRLPAAKAGGVASPPASGHSAHHPLRRDWAWQDTTGSRSVAAAEGMAVELRARLLRLRHPNIVTVREVSSHASSRRGAVSSVRVVSDYVDDAGDLHNLLHTRLQAQRFLSEEHIYCIFAQMCLALKYLHDNGVCHGVLHPRNVLLEGSSYTGGDGQPPLTVRLTDFGCGHLVDTEGQSLHPRTTYRPGPPTLASDMWSLGAILFEMTALTVPVSLLSANGPGARLSAMPPGAPCGPSTADLLSRLLDPEPDARPGIDTVLLLPLVQYHVRALMARIAETPPELLGGASSRSVQVVRRLSGPREASRERERMRVGRPQEAQRGERFEERWRRRRDEPQEVARSGQLARLAARGGGTSQPHHDMPDIATMEPSFVAPPENVPKPPQAKPAAPDPPKDPDPAHFFSREPRRGSSSSGRRSDEAERAHLNALKQARIEAHNERMALQRRMSGVGGRPTNAASVVAAANGSRLGQARASAHLALSPETRPYAHTSAPPDRSGGHAVPTSSPARRRNSTETAAAEEAAHLERLRLARIEAHNERLALQRKMGAVGGRPVKRLPGRHGGEAEDVISPHRNKRDVETSARRKKDDENKAYLERLKLARIQAHEERLALQRKMKSMGGRPESVATATEASALKSDSRVQDKEGEYLEQLRQARVEAFEARKALAERRGGGPGVTVAGSGVGNGNASRSTSEKVLRAKSQRKAQEQALHERRLSEARRAAYEERRALEAKMRNGGRTPKR